MSTATSNDLPIYDHHAGVGPTLVFLHYWGGSSRTWQPVVDELAGRDTLTIDFRGWGRSSSLNGSYDLAQLAQDTVNVISAERLTEFVLVGHSMGGKVAQLVAATHPAGLLGVVLAASGPAKPASEITPDYQAGLAHAYDSADAITGAIDNILTATSLDDSLKSQILEDTMSAGPLARTAWPLGGVALDITEDAARIQVPVLVLAGEHDQVDPVEVLRENLFPYLADAEFAIISDTGHLMPLEAPGPLASAINGFVSTTATK